MASLYDSASLVMIPSGVKESKLYSIKPTDGGGDFTFSRGTDTATRVNASGLIEKERGNLLTWSNDYSNWIKTDVTATSGQTGYDGSSDAWLLTSTGTGNNARRDVAYSGVSSFSVYAKAGTADGIRLRFDAATDRNLFVDLTDGSVITGVTTAFAYSVEDVGGGWYRVTATADLDTGINVRILVVDGTGAGTTGTIYIQDAMLNEGLVAQPYIETTTAAVYEGITDNLPRLDYSGGASCPSLLLEPQRTNLITQSEYLDGAPFKSRVIITDNAIVSPEGLQNAGKIVATSVSGSHALDYIPSVVASDYSMSIYAKAGELSKFVLLTNNRGTNMARGFDVSDGTTFANDLGYNEPTSYSIEEVGNDWYLCTMQFPKTSAGGAGMGVYLNNDSGQYSFTGNDVDGMYFWGWQLEAGSYPTSYIPTYGTSATRSADAALKTGVDSLIADNEGTLFMEVTPTNFEGDQRFGVSDNVGTNRCVLRLFNPSNIQLSCVIGSSVEVSISNSGYTSGNTYKIAGSWENNNAVIYINGVQVATDTSCNTTASAPMNRISFDNGAGTAKFENPVKQALYFPTRLTNAELAALTTI